MPSSFETGVKKVQIAGADGQVPFEMQSQSTPQTKEVTGASVAAAATTTIATIQVTGFSTVGIIVNPSASHNYTLNVYASPDGTIKADKLTTSSATGGARSPIVDCPAEYVIVEVNNADAASKTYDVWSRKMNR
jgi:hypothetical protein